MASDTVVTLANKLLQRLELPYRVSNAEQCDSSVFIETFSRIAPRIGGEWPEDASASKETMRRRSRGESQARIQLILDTLLAMLSTDLSHISAQAVVNGDRIARTYLLEIFLWVLDYLDEVSHKLAQAKRTASAGASAALPPPSTAAAARRVAGRASGTDGTDSLLSTPSLSFSSLSSDSSVSIEASSRTRERPRSGRRTRKRRPTATASIPQAIERQERPRVAFASAESSGSLCSVSDLADADISSAESHEGRAHGPHHVMAADDISISSIASDSSKTGSLLAASSTATAAATTSGNLDSTSAGHRRSKRRRHHWDGDVVASAPVGHRPHDKSGDPALPTESPVRQPATTTEPVSSTPKKPSIARRIDYSSQSHSTSTGSSSRFSSTLGQPGTHVPATSTALTAGMASSELTRDFPRATSASHPTTSSAPTAASPAQLSAAAASTSAQVPSNAAHTGAAVSTGLHYSHIDHHHHHQHCHQHGHTGIEHSVGLSTIVTAGLTTGVTAEQHRTHYSTALPSHSHASLRQPAMPQGTAGVTTDMQMHIPSQAAQSPLAATAAEQRHATTITSSRHHATATSASSHGHTTSAAVRETVRASSRHPVPPPPVMQPLDPELWQPASTQQHRPVSSRPTAVSSQHVRSAPGTHSSASSSTENTSELLRGLPSTGLSGSTSLNTTDLLASEEGVEHLGSRRSTAAPRSSSGATAAGTSLLPTQQPMVEAVPILPASVSHRTTVAASMASVQAAQETGYGLGSDVAMSAVATSAARPPPSATALVQQHSYSQHAMASSSSAVSAAPPARSAVSRTTIASACDAAPPSATTQHGAAYPHVATSSFTASTRSAPSDGSLSLSVRHPAAGIDLLSDPTTTAATAAVPQVVSSFDSVRPHATDSAPSGESRNITADTNRRPHTRSLVAEPREDTSTRAHGASQHAQVTSTSSVTSTVRKRPSAVSTQRVPSSSRQPDDQRSARSHHSRHATQYSSGTGGTSRHRSQCSVSPSSHCTSHRTSHRSAKPSHDVLTRSPLHPVAKSRLPPPKQVVEDEGSDVDLGDFSDEFSDNEHPPSPTAPAPQRHGQQAPVSSPPPTMLKFSEARQRIKKLDTGYRGELSRFRRRTRSMTAGVSAAAKAGRAVASGGEGNRTVSARRATKASVQYGLDGRRVSKRSTRTAVSNGRHGGPASSAAGGHSLRTSSTGGAVTTSATAEQGKSRIAASATRRSPRTLSHHRNRPAKAAAASAGAAVQMGTGTSHQHASDADDIGDDFEESADQLASADEENQPRGPVPLSAGLLPAMVDRFPHIQVTRQTAQKMLQQQTKQMKSIINQKLQDKQAPDQPAKLIAEAERRQAKVVSLLRKEIAHNQRMQDQREAATRQREVTTQLRERRHASARAHRYYNDFELKMKSKLAKQRNAEEQIFRKLFEDGLSLQRSRIRELRSYAKEKGKEYAAKLQDDIDSMENYYRDQFSMLAEVMEKERNDEAVRQAEQNKAVDRLKRELRKKMEDDITRLQEALDHGEEQDAAYVRQLEADRLRHEMQMMHGPVPL
ncbi:mucin-19-like isoform X2 [Sycon ciliatum]|uniref:mucin-19-like isoform X2 n=1 Tax=Sycon ciliatum TaxID=27933 RepID=UPI0031F5F820